MSDLQNLFGRELRAARSARGLTQAQLAERIDRSLDMVGRLERGEISPSFETIERLIQVLDMPAATLFGGADALETPRSGRLAELVRTARQLDEDALGLAIRLLAAIPEPKPGKDGRS